MDRKSEPTKYEKQAQERMQLVIEQYFGGSQQRLADKSGINKASVSQYVNGKNVPSNFNAVKICKTIGINPAWLMGFDVPMFEQTKKHGEIGSRAELESSYIQQIESYLPSLDADLLKRLASYAERLYALAKADEKIK